MIEIFDLMEFSSDPAGGADEETLILSAAETSAEVWTLFQIQLLKKEKNK